MSMRACMKIFLCMKTLHAHKNCTALIITLPNSSESVKIGSQLSANQIQELTEVLNDYAEAFSLHGEIGCATTIKHSIEINDKTKPIAEPLRRKPLAHVEETKRQIQTMLEDGIISESSSPWASPYIVVKKKTGDNRVCIEFRKIHEATKKNVYPLPSIDKCLETLAGKQYFSQFDF